jgi:serine kinase of HPr protein (carbohydrate metabolism regulator)
MSAPLHATCIAISGRGVLLIGQPGAGKSDLALRLIDRGAELVSDDGTLIKARGGRLIATPPATIAGRIEVRGLGILTMPYRPHVALALCVALDQAIPRMPEEKLPTREIEGLALPLLAIAPFEASAPVKVEQALMLYGLSL